MVVRLWYHPVFFRGKKLPPGSMGWPYIGETLQVYSENPNIFFSAKQKRYGDIVKTHILGCPCIMISSPEAAKFILEKKAHLFKPTFPSSKECLLGPNGLFFQQGKHHARLKKTVESSFQPEAIAGIAPDIESIALHNLNLWEDRTIITFQEMKKYSFDVATHSIFNGVNDGSLEDLNKYYRILEKGYNSFPINFPGTRYNRSIKARKKIGLILRKIMAERLANRNVTHKDLLESLMVFKDESGQPLANEQIEDNVVGVLFAAQDTTATVLTWLLKFLTDYPMLLEAVTAEQKAIKEIKGNGSSLTLGDTKKMFLTTRVIRETLRVATVLSFTFREAVADIEYKGYLIPKGWKVMPIFRNIHHNPEFFPDPHKFDPSRFEVPLKPNTFMPFGNGAHSCPGNQLALTEMLILLHHLTTKYRWETVRSEDGIEHSPFPIPKQGLPLRLIPKSLTTSTQSAISLEVKQKCAKPRIE
ncbi:hypothetical protein SUGI_0808700 [Cryptomeria japonica]|nr:hypothetical protein SUGI_0808700 [Cryptomeria japonica]